MIRSRRHLCLAEVLENRETGLILVDGVYLHCKWVSCASEAGSLASQRGGEAFPPRDSRPHFLIPAFHVKPSDSFGRLSEKIFKPQLPMNPIPRKKAPNRGFALVITLSLMVLITLIAVAMLGLSTIELRKSAQGEARAAAEANARLGLMLALGELQSEMGDDRRISADASVLDSSSSAMASSAWAE